MNPNSRIVLSGVSKQYSMTRSAAKRLWSALIGDAPCPPVFSALSDVNLSIQSGETVGIIGPNGAGKSTLLQIICGVLAPTTGKRFVDGRVTALLELGAGFSMEMTGRENILLNGPLLGLTAQETSSLLPQIIAFADIGPHIDQPVKTYSSGMFVRLAFSLVTAARPDVLIIDEALSVGDAAFAIKSFDRILQLKAQGVTILFCSHALYQVQAICDRVIWLLGGRIQADGAPRDVIGAYQTFLNSGLDGRSAGQISGESSAQSGVQLTSIECAAPPDGIWKTGDSSLEMTVGFNSDPDRPSPHVAVLVYGADARLIASVGTHNDSVMPVRDAQGRGRVTITFPQLPLLQGHYRIDVVLLCDRGVLFLDTAASAVVLQVEQRGLEMGVVTLNRQWGGVAPIVVDSVPIASVFSA